jgi:hypothetical protein
MRSTGTNTDNSTRDRVVEPQKTQKESQKDQNVRAGMAPSWAGRTHCAR